MSGIKKSLNELIDDLKNPQDYSETEISDKLNIIVVKIAESIIKGEISPTYEDIIETLKNKGYKSNTLGPCFRVRDYFDNLYAVGTISVSNQHYYPGINIKKE